MTMRMVANKEDIRQLIDDLGNEIKNIIETSAYLSAQCLKPGIDITLVTVMLRNSVYYDLDKNMKTNWIVYKGYDLKYDLTVETREDALALLNVILNVWVETTLKTVHFIINGRLENSLYFSANTTLEA